MTILIAGASGATGRHLVDQLLERGCMVRVIVRSADKLSEAARNNSNLSIIKASILDLNEEELSSHVTACNAVACCLGHAPSWNGIYGHPRRLVVEATRRLCKAVVGHKPSDPVKFVLMNSSGVINRDLNEKISIPQQIVIGLLRLLLPPHVDNENAANYLRTEIGQNDSVIRWVAVRPDGLVNEEKVTSYHAHPSPTRSAIFNAGKVSRINAAHFMAELITNNELWNKWKGQMPVLYGDN
jgi:nucleoside-diphosphate-sugar epimerase